jgi:hypothetical protein
MPTDGADSPNSNDELLHVPTRDALDGFRGQHGVPLA